MDEQSKPPFAVFPGGQPERANEVPARQYQELWFSLSRLPWASLVLVPLDQETPAADIANSLADVGTRLRDAPVTAIVANGIDFKSVRALADLQPRLNAASLSTSIDVVPTAVRREPGGEGAAATSREIRVAAPLGRAIIAIRPVVTEPLGVAIAHAADAVVLCVQVGRTTMKAARRTIELIGPERVIGVLLVR
jgi:hypothetical protein